MWEDKVYFVKGNKFNGSGVLISNKRILTASHIGFALNNSYNVCGSKNQNYSAKCCFISKKLDFAFLQSDEFEETSLYHGILDLGRKYYIMVSKKTYWIYWHKFVKKFYFTY